MLRILSILIGLSALGAAPPARSGDETGFAQLRMADARLLAIAAPMMEANARLCETTMPVAGLSLHGTDQYGATPENWFANGPVTISTVAPGSNAAKAGLFPDDAVIAIGSMLLEDLPMEANAPRRDAVFAALAEQGQGNVMLTIMRDGNELEVELQANPACRVLVELVTTDGMTAQSDGKIIQIGQDLASNLSDGQLASVFAHELAHVVLAHRKRLGEAGVSKGLAGELGRDQRLNREAEIEADRMSVHLLANAGYDPQLAPQFWLSAEGRRMDRGILRSWKYPSAKSRAEILAREISFYLPLGRGPSWPAHLLDRR